MSTSYHHGDLRNALLDAAERMVDADVSREFSLRELAREAGVSHGAPYKHFVDRDDMVHALAVRWMAAFVAAQEGAAAGDDARADLLATGLAYVDWARAHPSRFTVIFDPAINHGPDASGEFGRLALRHQQLLTGLVGRLAAGAVSVRAEDSTVAAQRLWVTVHGLATLALLGHLPADSIPKILEASLPDESALRS